MRKLGISRPQASADLRLFLRRHPEAIMAEAARLTVRGVLDADPDELAMRLA
jgi:hypothetical protein